MWFKENLSAQGFLPDGKGNFHFHNLQFSPFITMFVEGSDALGSAGSSSTPTVCHNSYVLWPSLFSVSVNSEIVFTVLR